MNGRQPAIEVGSCANDYHYPFSGREAAVGVVGLAYYRSIRAGRLINTFHQCRNSQYTKGRRRLVSQPDVGVPTRVSYSTTLAPRRDISTSARVGNGGVRVGGVAC